MKRKTLIYLMLLLLGISAFTGGCGQKQMPQGEEESPAVAETEMIKPVIVAEEMMTEEGTQEDSGGPAEAYTDIVEISGKEIAIGKTSYRVLVEDGFVPIGEVDENEIVFENDIKEVEFKLPDGGRATLFFQGKMDAPAILDGCHISGFKGDGITFDLGNEITDKTTESDIVEIGEFAKKQDGSYEKILKNGYGIVNGSILLQFDEDGTMTGVEYVVDNINF